MNTHFVRIVSIGIIICILAGCEEYLSLKPDKKFAVPTTAEDFQLLLDSESIFNTGYTALGDDYSDDFLVQDVVVNTLNSTTRNLYTFRNEETIMGQWSSAYQTIYYANVVLEGVNNSTSILGEDQMRFEGTAHFFRAFAYFQLVQAFAPYYDGQAGGNALGVPIRYTSAVDETLKRARLEENFSLIMTELKQAIKKLPVTSLFPTRPNRVAAYALMARVQLATRQYEEALAYADSALALNNTLVDYKFMDKQANPAFGLFNAEVIFHSTLSSILQSPSRAYIHPELFALYAPGDLRKEIFFYLHPDGYHHFKGGYDGLGGLPFNGLSTSELFLIRAECLARSERFTEALVTMNTLLQARWDIDKFEPLTLGNTPDVITKILEERRKELVFRGLRWTDLRRLVIEDRYDRPIERVFNGETYLFPAEDIPDYVFLIPEDVIELGGYPQTR